MPSSKSKARSKSPKRGRKSKTSQKSRVGRERSYLIMPMSTSAGFFWTPPPHQVTRGTDQPQHIPIIHPELKSINAQSRAYMQSQRQQPSPIVHPKPKLTDAELQAYLQSLMQESQNAFATFQPELKKATQSHAPIQPRTAMTPIVMPYPDSGIN